MSSIRRAPRCLWGRSRFTAYGLRLTAYGLRFTAYGLRFTVYGLRFTVYGLRFTVNFCNNRYIPKSPYEKVVQVLESFSCVYPQLPSSPLPGCRTFAQACRHQTTVSRKPFIVRRLHFRFQNQSSVCSLLNCLLRTENCLLRTENCLLRTAY
jgi:hypothetical protein